MSKNGQIGKTENMEMLGKLRLKQLPKCLLLILLTGILSIAFIYTLPTITIIIFIIGMPISIIYGMKIPKYAKIIIKSGFQELLIHNDIHNQDRMTGQMFTFSDRHVLKRKYLENNENALLNEKITKLEKLKIDLEQEKFSENEKNRIMETINYLISVASNLVKNSKYFGYGYLLGYDVDDKTARVIINDGNIYFFDDDTYEMFEDETIMNNEISHIEIYTTEENAPTYNPKYQNKPTAPSSASVNLHWDNEWMQKNVEHEYQRRLLEYQANLINTQMHNQNEERKYQESQGKTREVKYIDICFKDPNIEKLSWKYSEGHFYIKEQLPAVDIVDLDTGKTQKGETPKEEKIIKKIKIGDEKLCYIELAKNLYISHNIKDNVLELNVSNGNHIFITKYTNVDFKQMAKKLKSESRTVENGEKAFKKAELDDGATRFWGMVDDPKVSDTDVLYFLMEYQNIVYEIKRTYKKEDDQYIDYDEEIDGKLEIDEKYFDALEASMSIIKNIKS